MAYEDITYEALQVRHPEYDSDYWGKIRVLYEGSNCLQKVLTKPEFKHLRDQIFPQHLGEEDYVYAERCKRACYLPYMGQLVDYLLAMMFSDPVEMTAGGETEDQKPGSVEPFYDEFFKDTSRPGGLPVSFNQLMRDWVLDAVRFQRGWLLVDLPKPPSQENGDLLLPANRMQEEALGLDRAYCVRLDPEDVVDWEYDDDTGQLLWALVRCMKTPRLGFEGKRNFVEESYTLYTPEGWLRCKYIYKKDRPPRDKQKPNEIEEGTHSFGQVPIVPLYLPHGLWVGGKLENLAVEIFNKRSALSWGQYRSLFQVIVTKLQAPDPMNPISEDSNRGFNQILGPGRVWTGAEKDSLQYVGPDAAPFAEARADLRELRDEMHRVVNQMAQSVDNTGAALQRSARSKQVDQASASVLCREIGRYALESSEALMGLVSAGRQEGDKEWHAAGLSDYDDVSTSDFITEAATLETVPIPSPTFQTLYKYELATRLLPGATDEQKEQIMEELEGGHSAEDEAAKAGLQATVEALENPEPKEEKTEGGNFGKKR